MEKVRLAIFVSGSGSNMQVVMDASKNGRINADVVLVIASNETAYALQRAKAGGVDAYVCAAADFTSYEARDKKICQLLKSYRVDYIVLAGYLGIITDSILENYENRIINIHPSLLPKFGGRGFYGLRVHEAVINAGEKETGVTVHFVDKGTDTGQIIRQKFLAVLPSDTPETLQKRVLSLEHELLTEVLADLCAGKTNQSANKV